MIFTPDEVYSLSKAHLLFYKYNVWNRLNVTGAGTVSGPVSSTVNALALWNATDGTVLKNSSVLLSGTSLTGLTSLAIGVSTFTSGSIATSSGALSLNPFTTLNLNSKKIVSLADGTAAQDAATVAQILALAVADPGISVTVTPPNAIIGVNHDGEGLTFVANQLALELNGTKLSKSASGLTVNEAAVDHNSLLNFVANKHIDHSAVSVIAGTGLSGGGDLTSSRTFNLANTAVTPGLYSFPNITIDAQGRITLASDGFSNYKTAVKISTSDCIFSGYNPTGGSAGTGNFTGIDLTETFTYDSLEDVDGNPIALNVGDRVLVQFQYIDYTQNGIYVVTVPGVTGEMERAPDQDGTPIQNVMSGDTVYVQGGSTNQRKVYTLYGTGILTLNIDVLIWIANGALPTDLVHSVSSFTNNKLLKSSGFARNLVESGITVSGTDSLSGVNDYGGKTMSLTVDQAITSGLNGGFYFTDFIQNGFTTSANVTNLDACNMYTGIYYKGPHTYTRTRSFGLSGNLVFAWNQTSGGNPGDIDGMQALAGVALTQSGRHTVEGAGVRSFICNAGTWDTASLFSGEQNDFLGVGVFTNLYGYYLKNGAISGASATNKYAVRIEDISPSYFAGTVAVANGTLTGHAINLGQLTGYIDSLSADTIASGDKIPFRDVSGSDDNYTTAANFIANLGIQTTTNAVTAASTFFADERILRSDGTGRGSQSSNLTLSDAQTIGTSTGDLTLTSATNVINLNDAVFVGGSLQVTFDATAQFFSSIQSTDVTGGGSEFTHDFSIFGVNSTGNSNIDASYASYIRAQWESDFNLTTNTDGFIGQKVIASNVSATGDIDFVHGHVSEVSVIQSGATISGVAACYRALVQGSGTIAKLAYFTGYDSLFGGTITQEYGVYFPGGSLIAGADIYGLFFEDNVKHRLQGDFQIGFGNSGTYARPSITACVNSTPVGNVGGGTDNLMTYSLPENTLTSGVGIRIKAWGTTANNANGKTVTLNFGSIIASIVLTALILGDWEFEADVLFTGSSTQSYRVKFTQTGAATLISSGNLTETDTSAIIIKNTGTVTGVPNNNDITQNGMTVELLRQG